jgi:hypothetical protein
VKRDDLRWKEVGLPALQTARSSGYTYFVPPTLRPAWAQQLKAVTGAWMYYYGARSAASTASLSTGIAAAHLDVEREDPSDPELLKYDRYFYVQTSDGRVYQAGPWKSLDYGHHLRRRPECLARYSSDSRGL